MKTLNLVYPKKSDIKYRIDKFPDGQQQISLNVFTHDIVNNLDFAKKQGVTIKSRLNNFQDLELIICATKSLRNLGVKEIHLYTPYFLGSRSDRQFEEGSNNYLKDVICPIINSLNFESVTVLDPHSDVLEACIERFKKKDNYQLISWAIANIPRKKQWKFNDMVILSPDAGANKKIYKIAEQIGYTGDIITCSKNRDVDGKLTKTFIPLNATLLNKDFIIVDDICDGGATFINIAKEIKKWDTTNSCKIYLIITHGIFSKGFNELSKYFDGIYCTNSYKSLEDEYSMDGTTWMSKNVKQLNVF